MLEYACSCKKYFPWIFFSDAASDDMLLEKEFDAMAAEIYHTVTDALDPK